MARNKSLRLLGELQRIFEGLNQDMFQGRLKTPAFVIHVDKKPVFRFIPESYHIVVGSRFAEVPTVVILRDLLHEMVHISNWSEGIVDCTSNQYHNRHFLEMALGVGLFVIRHKTQGWGITQLTLKAPKGVCKKPMPDAVARRANSFKDLRVKKRLLVEGKEEITRAIKARGSRKVCFLKYECSCPPPHNSIRSGRRPDGSYPLKATCQVCGQEFNCTEG